MVVRRRRASGIVHRSILLALSALAALSLASCGEFVPLGTPPSDDDEGPRLQAQSAPCLFFDSDAPTRCKAPATRCTGPCCNGCSSHCAYQECDHLGKCQIKDGHCAADGVCVALFEPAYCADDSLR